MTPRGVRRGLGLVLSAVSIASVVGGVPGAAAAPAQSIHPGVTVNFGGVSCTAAAVMHKRHTVYLVVPSSCGGIDLGKTQDGCSAPESPVGSPVSIEGAKHRGTLVYSSFNQMQLEGVHSPNRCYYNDFALVQVNRRDRALVSPTIPGTGAPKRVLPNLPADGTALQIGADAGTAGGTFHRGWALDATSMTAMWKVSDVGTPVTVGNNLVGMLLVLPKGAIPVSPLQEPAEIYNMSRAITELHRTPGFRHVTLLKAGERAR